MVTGNYIMYGDRPTSDSEIVDDHVASRTAERRPRRKARTAAELQHSLNLVQLDNETDSIKYEKRAKEPRLLRYVPTTDVEEHYVSDKFETYDLKPSEATPRRYAFKKKPRNPADGSVNYAYSRSSSSCSSPSGNLPPIAEHAEQPGTFRRTAPEPLAPLAGYESKLDKYFTKPKEVKPFSAKGSHPDSLYRVPADNGAGAGKMGRALRLMRWPVALVVVCVALAVFVYFLMPDNFQSGLSAVNATYWESNVADADTHRAPEHTAFRPETRERIYKPDTRTPEIDFYDADINKNDAVTTAMTDKTPKKKLPVPPVYPTHLTPEVQYGNENDDTDNSRSPKMLHQANSVTADSTLKPHITQKPEKPLAIYFKDGEGSTTTTTTEAVSRVTTMNDYINYGDKQTNNKHEDSFKPYPGLVPWPVNKDKAVIDDPEPAIPSEIQDTLLYYKRIPSMKNFTSGHSKLFGISIEDAEKVQSTTQSAVYNTRVSPTLPTWRDGDDTTTKKYPVYANADVSQCRSTSLPLCRGVLPYDLASSPATYSGVSVSTLLPHIEFVAATNCSARFRSFACALLEPECSPPPQPPKMPCYKFCRAIVDSCESEFPRELRTVFKCERYSSVNCVAARVPCTPREMACGDGTCIPRDWICDGARDCPAGEDENQCHACDANEFRCKSGTCIHMRWRCDGYADCPEGEDELEAECGARDEEPAGSAPAPAVHRPHRPSRAGKHKSKAGDNESSKELLITSESSNALKRNFTRRPSLSRLTPYSPPMRQDPHLKVRKFNVEENVPKKNSNKQELNEDVNVDDLGFFGDTLQENVEEVAQKPNNQSKLHPEGLAPMPRNEPLYLKDISSVPPTKLDKTINKLERVIDGKSLWRKIEQDDGFTEDYPDSIENRTTLENVSKAKGLSDTRADETRERASGRTSAHASPCPSGELRCVDGRCITLAQLCDGTIDCTDHADEDNCYT